MKLTSLLSTIALAASTSLAMGDSPQAFTPVGELNINTSLVQVGVKPVLNWNISFPSNDVEDVITINDDDSITTDQAVHMEVRLLGAAFSTNGVTPSPVQFLTRTGPGLWNNTFFGTEDDINPAQVLISQEVSAGVDIDFAARGRLGSFSWTPYRHTLSESFNVIALKDGDDIPTYAPAFNQNTIEDHVSAYVQDGKISIGPREVIYLFELFTTNTRSSAFDLQDVVVIVTFDEIED